MRPSDNFCKWIEWSEEDNANLGLCPSVITGIRGSDPSQLYEELCEIVDGVSASFQASGHALPEPKFIPIRNVA